MSHIVFPSRYESQDLMLKVTIDLVDLDWWRLSTALIIVMFDNSEDIFITTYIASWFFSFWIVIIKYSLAAIAHASLHEFRVAQVMVTLKR